MRAKVILIAIAAALAIGSTSLWFLMSEKRAAQERHETFFGTTQEFPTSGGRKMKPEW